MRDQMDYVQAAKALQHFLLLSSFPVGVRFSEKKDLPEKARRPTKTVGYPLAACQGVALARTLGWTVGFLKEDHACPPSFLIFGLDEKAEEIDYGEMLTPLYGNSPELCESSNEYLVTLPMGKYKSMAVAPLQKNVFEPDLILIYGNPAQISRLVQGALYHRGGAITSSFMGRNSCTSELVAPMVKDQCQVIVPGSGERVFALTQDTEMCFSFPVSWLKDIVSGLEATHQLGAMRYPTPFQGMRERPQFPEKYRSMLEKLDLDQ